MITPHEAIARLRALAQPVEIETVSLGAAANRYLAAPLTAKRSQPSRDLSAMDGYAIRSADQAGPWRVVGESAAGRPWAGIIGRNEAVRIFTGAAVPDGAGMVIVQEDVTRDGDGLAANPDVAKGGLAHIRLARSDFKIGQLLLEKGDRLTAARIGLAAMGGYANLAVRRRIRIAIISTGSELASVGSEPSRDRLPSSNGVMLRAMLTDLPADVCDFGIIPDDRAALSAAFKSGADFDVIVSTGGASVGDHDLVRPALIDAGAVIDFWKIAMRPGKPMMAGRLGKAIALGLPGNPVSAFVTATLFLKPLIAHLAGASTPEPQMIKARLAEAMPAVGGRTDYVRACWSNGAMLPLPGDSGMLLPLASADALIMRPAGSAAAEKGDDVTAIMLT